MNSRNLIEVAGFFVIVALIVIFMRAVMPERGTTRAQPEDCYGSGYVKWCD